VPFQAQIDLLHVFLTGRDEIVERIQTLLNAQRKPTEYLQDGALLSRHIDGCFQSGLRDQLEAAHWATGFKPRPIPGLHNGPADPAEMMMRAFHLWGQTRWPGRNGRLRYAHTLFNLHVVRCLELLSMRLWDEGAGTPAGRLTLVQQVLDELWRIKMVDQPALVRDARWLLQTAQSLATDDLDAYFRVEEHIAETLSEGDRIEIYKAGVRMTGGHLRSQIRYHAISKSLSFDDESLVLKTRDSNALDFALLIDELVPLLEAYENAVHGGDNATRLGLADAICQGMSPDPELFLNRLDLLRQYSAIDTPVGRRRHAQLFQEYEARIGRVAKALCDDCPRFSPVAGTYSPYGVLYGFSADLVKHMVLKATQPDAVNHFCLEDVFVADAAGGGKLAWVNGWRKLPHLSRDVEKQFDYPQEFAEDIFGRLERALKTFTTRAAHSASAR
jgi:hypothetical protein